jgi:4-hydroxymandelate oxidase
VTSIRVLREGPALDLDELEALAWERDDATACDPAARGDVQAWRSVALRPRVLREVTTVDTTCRVLGRRLRTPIVATVPGRAGVAPSPAGALIQAARDVGAAAVLRPSHAPLASIGDVGPTATWLELQSGPEVRFIEVARAAREAGYSAIVTRDAAASSVARLVDAGGPPVVAVVTDADGAARCVEAGASALIAEGMAALGEVVAIAGERAEVYAAGGIRRGTDLLKALALGARAVVIGAPLSWGLSVQGAKGVVDVLRHLHEELRRSMVFCGAASLVDIGADLVVTGAPAMEPVEPPADPWEEGARRVLDPQLFDLLAGGSEDELTLRANARDWRSVAIRRGARLAPEAVDTSVEIQGRRHPTPVVVAPTGHRGSCRLGGELAMAQGAAQAGALMVLSFFASVTLEDVAACAPAAPRWLQLDIASDRAATGELVERAAAAGYEGLVLTADQPAPGRSPRRTRGPFVPRDDDRMVHLPGCPPLIPAWYQEFREGTPALTLDDVRWLAGRTELPVIVKGVLRADDATRCVEAGARGIVVSNHGGRMLDTALSTARALPAVCAAVGERAEVYVDGGISSGDDVLRALTLGARAVMVGRRPLWGLAVGGAPAVGRVLGELRDQLADVMAASGVRDVDAMQVRPAGRGAH